MAWLSFDDQYTQQAVWDHVPSYEARWVFHCIVERCCAQRRYDGVLPWRIAERCSDVSEPLEAIKALIEVGLLVDLGAEVRVPEIEGFLPPEGQRPENLLARKRANTADYRRRKCERGDHDSHCPSKTCPVKLAARGIPSG